MEELYVILNCPHCNHPLQVFKQEINCGIFRHGIYNNGTQLDPHASKEICDNFANSKENYGCGKPFRIFFDKELKIEPCDYI